MLNQDDLINVYDYIYSQGPVRCPIRRTVDMDPYGSHNFRDKVFIDWITANLPKGSRILDASCGRGHLALSLHEMGYDVEATEVSQWLVENDLKEVPFPVHLLRYDQLDHLPEKSFDCVCSNDVLEHMISEEAVLNALSNMFTLSAGAICIGVGTGRMADKYPRSLAINKNGEVTGKNRLPRSKALNLHTFRRPYRWWRKKIANRIMPDGFFKDVTDGNYFFFGMVKQQNP
jgi:SAM-dependent methyltransferase